MRGNRWARFDTRNWVVPGLGRAGDRAHGGRGGDPERETGRPAAHVAAHSGACSGGRGETNHGAIELAIEPNAPVTQAQYEDLVARHTALMVIVKSVVAADYVANQGKWELWLAEIHNRSTAETDPAWQLCYHHLLKMLEMMISTPRDPELRG